MVLAVLVKYSIPAVPAFMFSGVTFKTIGVFPRLWSMVNVCFVPSPINPVTPFLLTRLNLETASHVPGVPPLTHTHFSVGDATSVLMISSPLNHVPEVGGAEPTNFLRPFIFCPTPVLSRKVVPVALLMISVLSPSNGCQLFPLDGSFTLFRSTCDC